MAALAAALAIALAAGSGALDPAEQWLSDAWFGGASIAPSGRTVLVAFDHASARYAGMARLPRRDLADLLSRLDGAGAARILIDVGLGDLTNEAEDRHLERVLAQLGRRAALPSTAMRHNQTSWHRVGPLDRFARHVARTASDLALDSDGRLRRVGIEGAPLRPRQSSAAWLAGARERGDGTAPDTFRIDFAIALDSIPTIDAASLLQGATPPFGISGANVIVSGFLPASNFGLRTPRYGELARPQIEALAAETLMLGRTLQALPRWPVAIALAGLAALMGFVCVRIGALAGAGIGLCAIAGAAGAAAELQVSLGLLMPAVGAASAVLAGYAAAQVMAHPAFRPLRQAMMAVLDGIDIQALSRVASEDALTGLANRRAFETCLKEACAASDRALALLLCDLDGFKQVNDSLGHAAGDMLLREIARRLSEAAKPNAIVARLGGDEFAILLQGATRAHAARVAQRAVEAIAQPIRIGDQTVAVGISIGIAPAAAPADPQALSERADAAMYAAKRSRSGYGFAQSGSEAHPAELPILGPQIAEIRLDAHRLAG
jgi:diguanylate cyclase (GGDEF)-like protein